jgi:hypothetical protein
VQLDLYHQKLNGVFDELSPSGVIAKTLCGDVAHGLAKLETINTYERDLIYSAQHHGVSLSELARKLDFPWAQTHLHLLAEPPAQAVLQAQVARSWRTLARPPKSLAGVARGDDLLTPMKPVKGATKLAPCPASEGIEIGNSAGCPILDGQHIAGPRNRVNPSSKNGSRALVHSDKGELVPMADLRAARLYETGCDVFARPWLGIWEHEHFLQQVDLVMAEAAQGQGYVGARVMKRGETMFLILYWLLRNLQRLNECVAELKNERTMGVLLDDKVERARSHVQRGLRESLGSLQVTRELRWGPQE